MHGQFKFNFYSVAAIMIGAGTADFIVRVLVNSEPVLEIMIFPSPNIFGLWIFIYPFMYLIRLLIHLCILLYRAR